jgi:hypothetical protein
MVCDTVTNTLFHHQTGIFAVEKSGPWVMYKQVKMVSKFENKVHHVKWCKTQGGRVAILLISSFKMVLEMRSKV